MEHELTKPSAAGTPPSSAHGCVYSGFCKFMFHKLSVPEKNAIRRAKVPLTILNGTAVVNIISVCENLIKVSR